MEVVFKSYWRLEPRVRADGSGGNLLAALEARVHDPLWALGRQWQLAELQGEDAGSPIATSVRTRSGPLTRFADRDGAVHAYRGELPLELLVEHEPADAGDAGANPGNLPPSDRARAGLRLLDLLGADDALRERVRAALVERFQVRAAGPALARRAPDGVALELHLRDGGALEGLTPADAAAVEAALPAWRAWLEREVMDTTPDCWVPERMEYRFGVGGGIDDETRAFSAPEFRGGPIDWFHLDIDEQADAELPVELPALADVDKRSSSTLPVRAAFPGMPVNRWWEIEDGRVNLARVDAGTLDLARMLVVEFVAVHGNDWFVVPVDLPFGTLTVLDEVVVTNTFGERFLMPTLDPDGPPWSMFRHSTIGGAPDPTLLSLLPVIPTAYEGEPLEELLLMRDEMANLAWAVVKVQQGADGRPERPTGAPPSPALPEPLDPEALRYRLAGDVPRAWVPLVPVQTDPASGQIRLRRGRVERHDADGKPLPPERPRALLLEPGRAPFDIEEEELPRSGLRVSRIPVVGRWRDGRTLRWTGRRKRSGRGEGSSNLRFDQAIEPQQQRPEA
jgi:hypothetical protein